MGLSAGARLGPYEIRASLGAGGMGLVYHATDTKLGRPVALKIIRAELLANEESLRRFEREARLLASLNHPRIAAIHSIEESNGIRFLVLEYVPGSTLAERLRRGPLPIREALIVGKQIAEALEAAHAKDIIHRDLKPANIKISEDGQVKVLDFGLAKTIERTCATVGAESAATVSAEVSQGVTLLGTPAYMSPEQACGKELDSRTDIWSFGCVLYEALTAKQVFRGKTVTEVLGAVLEREPDWKVLPSDTPPALSILLHRCLRKSANSRLCDIGDARIELEDVLAGASPGTPKPAGMTRRAALSALAGAAAGAAGMGVFGLSRWHSATPRHLTQFSIPLAERWFIDASWNTHVGISPQGAHIAYNISGTDPGGNFEEDTFYLHSLSELSPKLLSKAAFAPFFSPDGHWLGFIGEGPDGRLQMRKIALSGGAPVTVSSVPDTFAGATWADDDTIYFVATMPGGVMRVPAAGGQPQEAGKIDLAKGERMHKYPHAVPGSKAVLFTVTTPESETFDDAHIAALNAETGQRKVLVEGGTSPCYSPSGHLIYARGGNLLAVRFDPKRLEVTGQPFTVLEGVLMSVNTGVANYDISASGDLIYVPGIADKGARTLVWADRNGKTELLPLPPRSYLHPRISPDMRQLAIEIEGPNHDFYVYDFARSVLSKMTTDGLSHWPVWSQDGKQLVYRSGPMGAFKMWQIPADRSHPAEQLPGTGISQSAESWSPDGHTIAYTADTPEAGAHIMVESLEGDHRSRQFVDIKSPAGSPKFSPDGHWLAYCSNESGKAQVYVQAFPGPGPKVQVSNGGGTDPVWKRTGGELYFRNGDEMMAVVVSTAPTFAAGRPQVLWAGHYSHGMSTSCGPPGATSSNYDVTADGRRFLMVKDEAPDTAVSKQIVVALAWANELNRLSKI